MKNHNHIAALAVLAAVAVGTAGCGSADQTQSDPAVPHELTVGTGTPLPGWDPYACTGGTRNVYLSVYDTLTRITPDGETEPSLAESWEYETPTRFTLTLREGVEFADGTAVDAAVVKANLDRAAASPTAVTAQFAADQPTITAVSDREVAIDLAKPDPDLPYLFSYCGGMIVHPDLVADPDRMAGEADGTGPYTYVADASIADSTYVFAKKDGYWNSDAYPFAKVTFSVIPDANAMISALLSDQVDIADGAFENVAQVEAAGKSAIHENISQYTLLINDRAGELVPALGDVRVRQALNYAIDRPAIIETLFGGDSRATPQLPAVGIAGYDASLDERYPYDPEKAKQLLAEAGYPDGFSMSVLTAPVYQFDTYLSAVADYWAKIGVQVDQEVAPWSTYLADLATTKYPVEFYPVKGVSTYSVLNKYFGPTAGLNPFKTSDAALSASLDAAAAGDEDALRAASEWLLDEAWYVAAGFKAQYFFFDSTRVTGIEMQKDDPTPLFYDWRPPAD